MAKKKIIYETIPRRTVMTRSIIKKEQNDNIEVVKLIKSLERKKINMTISTDFNEIEKQLKNVGQEKYCQKVAEIINIQKNIYEEILRNTKKIHNSTVNSNKKNSKNKINEIYNDCKYISINESPANNIKEKKLEVSISIKEIDKNIDNKKENKKNKKVSIIDSPKEEIKNGQNKEKYILLSGDEKYNTIQELINDAKIRKKMNDLNKKFN